MTSPSENPLPLIAIVGPTACGKTSRAVALALALDGEILSADSRQVYCGMDLGTGKDISDYEPLFAKYRDTIGGKMPGLHLVDICPAGTKYNLHRYLQDYYLAEASILQRGNRRILCGGTGMYAEAVLSGLRLPEVPENPELRASLRDIPLSELHSRLAAMKQLHNTTDVDTHARAVRALEIAQYYLQHPEAAQLADRSQAVPPRSEIFLIDIPRELRRQRITRRSHERINQGMIEEVEGLLAQGISPDDLIYYGLEYKFLTLHILGHITREEMHSQLETAIHQFAKRQMTWWRGMERRGFKLHPIAHDTTDEQFISTVKERLRTAGASI